MVSSLSVGVGAKVAKGDKILTLEAMKMQTTLYAPADGVIDEILAQAGEAVDTGDLIVRLRA
jgi:pyruvate carboxylase